MLRLTPLVLLFGCAKPPPEAPTEMSDLSRFLFRSFDDPEALAAGLDNLQLVLADTELTADDPADRSWLLDPLNEADLAAVTIPEGRLPSDVLTMGLAYDSPWAIDLHPSYMILSDLTVISDTAVVYERTFASGDGSCFSDASCELIETDNFIDRETTFFKMEYSFFKDYRWVQRDQGRAILSRGWIAESAHGDGGSNHLWQNYETDVWLEVDGRTWRFYAVYTEADYAGVGEDLARNLSRASAQDALETLDGYIAERQ